MFYIQWQTSKKQKTNLKLKTMKNSYTIALIIITILIITDFVWLQSLTYVSSIHAIISLINFIIFGILCGIPLSRDTIDIFRLFISTITNSVYILFAITGLSGILFILYTWFICGQKIPGSAIAFLGYFISITIVRVIVSIKNLIYIKQYKKDNAVIV